MCRLKIKIRVIGKKNQEFVRFQLTPNKTRQRGKYLTTLGYWDTRQNRQTRYIVLNLYKKKLVQLGQIKNAPLKFKNFIYLSDTSFLESGQEELILNNKYIHNVIDFQRLNGLAYLKKKPEEANAVTNNRL